MIVRVHHQDESAPSVPVDLPCAPERGTELRFRGARLTVIRVAIDLDGEPSADVWCLPIPEGAS